MANDFSGNPWFIDTAYSTPPSAGHIVSSDIRAASITWTTMAAGAQCQIKDRTGRIIMDSTDAQANVPVIISNPEWVEGFFVPILTSGKLTVTVSCK